MKISTTCISKKKINSSIRMEEETIAPQLSKPPIIPLPKASKVKQGIVSILGSDFDRGKSTAVSIRRTFSADMSSKQWLAQNGFFSPMKKIASSKDLAVVSAADHCSSVDVWSSILSKKKDDHDMSNLETPYIHPLVKRSTSSLSEKSLEICTESLGSETGSDSFSSYTPSETGDVEEEEKDEQQQQQYCSRSFEELRVVKYNYSKKSSSFPKFFPPPIPSLAKGENKPSLHMKSRRQDGRLILEAISIPPRNLFRAHRHDGRLLLTFIDDSTPTSSSKSEMEDYGEEFDEVFDDIDDQTPQFDYNGIDCPEQEEDEEEEEEEEEEEIETENILIEQKARLSSGVVNMKNFVTWSNKFNKVIVNLTGSVGSTELTEKLSQITTIPQSLPAQLTPSRPPLTAASGSASFNAYEYFWRKKPTVVSIANSPIVATKCNKFLATNSTATNAKSTANIAAYEQQDLVLMRGNKKESMNYLVPLQRGCKEQKGSLLIWEPYCIATS